MRAIDRDTAAKPCQPDGLLAGLQAYRLRGSGPTQRSSRLDRVTTTPQPTKPRRQESYRQAPATRPMVA